MMRRRRFFGSLSLLAAPAIIRTPGLLMPIRPHGTGGFTKDQMIRVLNAVKHGAGGEMPPYTIINPGLGYGSQ